jgi:hypothetical protein
LFFLRSSLVNCIFGCTVFLLLLNLYCCFQMLYQCATFTATSITAPVILYLSSFMSVAGFSHEIPFAQLIFAYSSKLSKKCRSRAIAPIQLLASIESRGGQKHQPCGRLIG